MTWSANVTEPLDVGGDERLDERLAGREMPVQGADADPGTAGDLVERRVDAVRLECLVGDLQ